MALATNWNLDKSLIKITLFTCDKKLRAGRYVLRIDVYLVLKLRVLFLTRLFSSSVVQRYPIGLLQYFYWRSTSD